MKTHIMNPSIFEILVAAEANGADINENTIDFGEGCVFEVSIEGCLIKFDAGVSSGVEYFVTVEDAIAALISIS